MRLHTAAGITALSLSVGLAHASASDAATDPTDDSTRAAYLPIIRKSDATEDFAASVSVQFANRSVWRGIDMSHQPVAQPTVTIAYKNITATISGTMLLKDDATVGSKGEFNRIESSLAYSKQHGALTTSIGIAHYAFPNSEFDDTTELFASLSYSAEAKTTLSLYWDIGKVKGLYAKLSGETEILKLGDAALKLGAYVAWGSGEHNRYWYQNGESGMTDMGFQASLTGTLAPRLEFSLFADFIALADRRFLASPNSRSHLVFGGALSYKY